MIEDFKVELEPMKNYFNEFKGYRININGLWLANLIQTCESCPEQYSMISLFDMADVGYFRLRHGHFRVDAPTCGDTTVYEKMFEEDLKGQFYTEEERIENLTEAIKEIIKYYRKGNEENEEDFI